MGGPMQPFKPDGGGRLSKIRVTKKPISKSKRKPAMKVTKKKRRKRM